jgi:DNA repair exonuclease SbcCD ATPase subunit
MILSKLRFKNFLSSGNAFVEFDLLKYRTAAIIGVNGQGKSTIFSAITFVLFNKTIKQITKSQIVNSINNKNCVVEIEFSVGDTQYLVRRGIKPNIFEIFVNGTLLDQTLVNDYQTHLEETILRTSYRTFLQTSIISIENYKPFMALPAAERRDFIEDILDIKVFSVMNQLVKKKNVANKEELKLLDLRLKSVKEKAVLLKNHITQLEAMQKAGIESIDTKRVAYLNEAKEALATVNAGKEELIALQEPIEKNKIRKAELRAIEDQIREFNTNISSIQRQLKVLNLSDTCPTCHQSVDISDTQRAADELKDQIEKLTADRDVKSPELDKFSDLDASVSSLQDQTTSINARISVANSTITNCNRMVASLTAEREAMAGVTDIEDKKADMKALAKEGQVIVSRITEVNTEQDYNIVMLEMFKDSGIKSTIVEQYIPVINTLANMYLEKLDFFVSFNLDSEFKEVIKSRHRDIFTYNSFSAGEKQRIDLALLFTFRQLARQKNSFICNLFALDELIDASIDAAGIDLLMEIFNSSEFDGSNILVISHRNKETLEDSFGGVYTVKKRDGFSELHENS